jgi:hypothetical protein
MHPNCQKIFLDHCVQHFKEGYKVLEVGPPLESKWYRKTIRQKKPCKWDTVDIRADRAPGGKHHDVTYTGTMYHYPMESNRYDIVFASMVLEHVPMPWEWCRELTRVTKQGGIVMILAPFVGKKHGDLDCWRVLPQGMEALAEWCDLEIVFTDILDVEPDDYHVDTLLIARKK